MGCLIKEIFFPISVIFLLGWLAADYYKTKKIKTIVLINCLVFSCLCGITIIVLQIYFYGFLINPWKYIPGAMTHDQYRGVNFFATLGRFMYVFIWLLPLAFFNLNILPFKLKLALALSSVLVLVLTWWIGASGLGIGRNLFSLIGPAMCISAAVTLSKLLPKHDIKKD